MGGGCISAANTGNISGDGFGSQVALGRDSFGAILLYIASPLYDKNRKRQMVGRVQAYKLVNNDVWEETTTSQQLGHFRNGQFGASMKALDNLVLVSAPYVNKRGAVTLYLWNSKKSRLRTLVKLIQPSDKYQAVFGTSLDLYKETNKRLYLGVGSIHTRYKVGTLQVLYQEKKKATKIAEFVEDKKDDTCGVHESFVLVQGEDDIPDVVAGGPYCGEVYVLGEK